jgi:hypothetical protein
MRENRLSGSEGGEPKPIGSPYPYNLIGRIDSTVATRRNVCAHLTVH